MDQITRRDFFAGCALAGMLANSSENGWGMTIGTQSEDAKIAFAYADAMVAASKECDD